MATPGQNKIKFNRKWMGNNPDPSKGPATNIVDTSQIPPVTRESTTTTTTTTNDY